MEGTTKNTCTKYIEDKCVCFDSGEPKGQCANCGDKWYNHDLSLLDGNDKASAIEIIKAMEKPIYEIPKAMKNPM